MFIKTRLPFYLNAEYLNSKALEGLFECERALSQMFYKVFLQHPSETHETYFQHAWFVFKMIGNLFFTSLLLLIHAAIPCLFAFSARNRIKELNRILRLRALHNK